MTKINRQSKEYVRGQQAGFQAGLKAARKHDVYKDGRRAGYGDLKYQIKNYLSGKGPNIKWFQDLLNVRSETDGK